jgi:hypothetical protein
VAAAPTYELQIGPDGGIAIHDWRPELRRQMARYWVLLAISLLCMGICLWFASLALEDLEAGIRYGTGRRRSHPSYLVSTGLLFAAIAAGFAIWALWKKLAVLRRLLDAPADLVLAPDRLIDRWGKLEILWRDLARVRLGIRDGAAAIRLDMTDGGGEVVLSPLYGAAALPLALDTLFALAYHLPVEGLPAGYRPHHPVLQELRPPPSNLAPLPGPAETKTTTRFFATGRKPSGLLILGGLFLCFGALVIIFGNRPGQAYRAMGWFGLFFFGLPTLGLIFGSPGGSQDFEADERGLRFDNLSALGHLPWGSVVAIDGWEVGDSSVYGFAVPDLAERIASLPLMLRLQYRLRTRNSPIIIRHLRKASLEPRQAVTQMRRWRCQAITTPAIESGVHLA